MDGTKFEANANKYKFVWKPTTFHKKLISNIREIFSKYGIKTNDYFSSFDMTNYIGKLKCDYWIAPDNLLDDSMPIIDKKNFKFKKKKKRVK